MPGTVMSGVPAEEPVDDDDELGLVVVIDIPPPS
jgi:hypothetical protein